MEDTAERQFRTIVESRGLIAWRTELGLHIGYIPDVPLVTVIADETFGRFTVHYPRKHKVLGGLSLAQCIGELEALVPAK